MISCYVSDHQKDWDLHLHKLAYAYNTSVHDTTGYSPFELMYGRKPKVPLDLILSDYVKMDDLQPDDNSTFTDDLVDSCRVTCESRYVADLVENMQLAYKNVVQTRDLKVDRQKLIYDRHLRPFIYAPGDWVLKNQKKTTPGRSAKLAPKWVGPYEVVEQTGPVNYKIKLAFGTKNKSSIVHHNRLKYYFRQHNSSAECDITDIGSPNAHEPETTTSTTAAPAHPPRQRRRRTALLVEDQGEPLAATAPLPLIETEQQAFSPVDMVDEQAPVLIESHARDVSLNNDDASVYAPTAHYQRQLDLPQAPVPPRGRRDRKHITRYDAHRGV
jgi:hypothetical protein